MWKGMVRSLGSPVFDVGKVHPNELACMLSATAGPVGATFAVTMI